MTNKKIIVAPLNWGLGHVTRSVPIINLLLENDFTPVLASDGQALDFLQKEFPALESLKLPSYGISYAKNLKTGLLLQIPKILKAVRKEHQCIQKYVEENSEVVGVISDNRFGARSTTVPSVYITHQIQVLSGFTSRISSMIHQRIIQKFDECWVPDSSDSQLSGVLSQLKNKKISCTYIGALSRFEKEKLPHKTAVLIVLSGIESQRKSLEDKMLQAFKNYPAHVVLVQGKIAEKQTVEIKNGIKVYNYLLAAALAKEINQAKIVICRSGYSSIMDLAVLQKRAFFIPTPNQPEQAYLARHLKTENQVPFCEEKDFHIGLLSAAMERVGLSISDQKLHANLLGLFKGE